MIQRQMVRVKSGFIENIFWQTEIFFSTVDLDDKMICECVRHQEESDDESQLRLLLSK